MFIDSTSSCLIQPSPFLPFSPVVLSIILTIQSPSEKNGQHIYISNCLLFWNSEIQSKLSWLNHLVLNMFKAHLSPSSLILFLLLLCLSQLMEEHDILPRHGPSRSSLIFQHLLSPHSRMSPRYYGFYLRLVILFSSKSFEVVFS